MRGAEPLAASAFFTLAPERITPEQEAAFFSSLKARNKTTKQTNDSRLAEIDAELCAYLQASAAQVSWVLDVGVSSGITTLELSEALRRRGFSPRVVGTDVTLEGAICSVPPWGRVLVDEEGRPLQFELLGRAIRAWPRRLDYVTGMAAVRWLAGVLLARGARRGRAVATQRVKLVSPRLRRHPEISIERDDLLKRNPNFVRRFDLIRAANVLNGRYFSKPDLERMISNAKSYLAGEGALLLVVRTHRPTGNQGTLFRLDADGRLAVVKRFGAGSELEALVLSAAE